MFSWSSFVVGFLCGSFFVGFAIVSLILIASVHQYKEQEKKAGEFAKKFQEGILQGAKESFRKK
jgi:hypothetical protein